MTERQGLSRWRATYFSLLARKKSRQKKAPSPTNQSYVIIAKGIFRFAVRGESKNDGHPVRSPMGLARVRVLTDAKIENTRSTE
jgi:hypothetical protein